MTTYTFSDSITGEYIDEVQADSLEQAVKWAAINRNPAWVCTES